MIRHLLNSKVDVIGVGRARDDVGGWKDVPAIRYKNLPCRIVWKQGSERIMFDKVTYYRDGKLYCNPITISTKDRIVFNGVDYEIVSINNPHQLNKFLIIEIKLVQ